MYKKLKNNQIDQILYYIKQNKIKICCIFPLKNNEI